jgi:arylsulfatase A-like enzyme
MYEHTIRVPMIFVGPGIPAGKQFQGQAYLRDLFPTLLELAGLQPVDCDGKSQVPVLRGKRPDMYDFTVGYFRDSQRMIRTDRWKLIEYPLVNRTQLFDLVNDPLEMKDLSKRREHAERHAQLSAQLAQWMQSHRVPD